MGNILEIDEKHLGDVICESSRVQVRTFKQATNGKVACKLSLGSEAVNSELRNEYKLLKKNPHPHLLTVFELCKLKKENRLAYFAEWLDGGSIWDALSHNTYTSLEALDWSRQMGSAVTFLHSRGITHGSLHPRKILLNSSQTTVKLSGFQPGGHEGEFSDDVVLYLCYFAPEAIALNRYHKNEHMGPAADTYSLAFIFYHLIARKLPFDASIECDSFLSMLCEKGITVETCQLMSPEMNDTIKRCLALSPHDRPSSTKLQSALENCRLIL